MAEAELSEECDDVDVPATVETQKNGERTVEFGWADNKPVSGRRAAKEKEKRKVKAGSFG